MKNIGFLSLLFILLVFAGCVKKHFNGIYTGVVVVNENCLGQIVECTGPDYLGQDSWTYNTSMGSTVYHHVFAVQNVCNSFTNAPGDTLHFRLVPNVAQNCMCIDLVAAPRPDAMFAIQIVP